MRLILIVSLFLVGTLAGCEAGAGSLDSTPEARISSAGSSTENSPAREKSPENGEPSAEKTPEGKKAPVIDSIYTDLAENKCKNMDSSVEEEWSIQDCGGIEGYRLVVSEGDLRQTIDIIYPGGKEQKLDLWRVVSSGFSAVGDKAEWRVRKKDGKVTPFALIVRYNVSEDPEDSAKITSYLTVSKITAERACVTDIVRPIRNANQKARDLALGAEQRPCLEDKR